MSKPVIGMRYAGRPASTSGGRPTDSRPNTSTSPSEYGARVKGSVACDEKHHTRRVPTHSQNASRSRCSTTSTCFQ